MPADYRGGDYGHSVRRERLMTFMNQKAREGGSGEDAQEGRKKRRGK